MFLKDYFKNYYFKIIFKSKFFVVRMVKKLNRLNKNRADREKKEAAKKRKLARRKKQKPNEMISKDCWLVIMSFIEEDKDLFAMRGVCRYFRRIFETPWLWQRRMKTHFQLNSVIDNEDVRHYAITSRSEYVKKRKYFANVLLAKSGLDLNCVRVYHEKYNCPNSSGCCCLPPLIPRDVVREYEKNKGSYTRFNYMPISYSYGYTPYGYNMYEIYSSEYDAREKKLYQRSERKVQRQQQWQLRRQHSAKQKYKQNPPLRGYKQRHR